MKFIWPFKPHYLTRDYYYKDPLYYGGIHAAADLVSNDPAKPMLAVCAGVLWHNPMLDRYGGWTCWIDTDDGWRITYYHMREPSPVPSGSRVQQGQLVGRMGTTGVVTGPHLHMMFWHKTRQSPESLARPNGWWAHDPMLRLGIDDGTVEEDNMAPPMKLIRDSKGTLWLTNGMWKLGIPTDAIRQDLINLGVVENTPVDQILTAPDYFMAWLQNYVQDVADIKAGNAAITGTYKLVPADD